MMNRPKIVAGNWKMNKSLSEALELAKEINAYAGDKQLSGVTKIVFPPLPFLHDISKVFNDGAVQVGAQNCHTHESGAYTGEVSAAMLRSVGCSHVLAGHSERRQYFGETSAQLLQKMQQALHHGLKPVYCVGETLDERKSGRHFEVVKQQLTEVLGQFKPADMQNVIVAYEPVWAIGTGETATSAQAQEMHSFIRTVLAGLFNKETADRLPVLYGGSCNAQNARELFSCADVDGGLIGGASLKADDFRQIMASF